jgi:hypothetical protein
MTPAGVRLAIIAMQEKFGGEAISTQVTAVENVVPQSASTPTPAAATPPTVPTAPQLPTVPAAHRRPLYPPLHRCQRRMNGVPVLSQSILRPCAAPST